MRHHYNNGASEKVQGDSRPNRVRLGLGMLRDKNLAFSAVFHTVLGIIGWPFGFLTLSKEDQVKAGIDLGGKVQDVENELHR